MATHKPALPGAGHGIESFLGKRELASVDVRTGLATFRLRPGTGESPEGPVFQVPLGAVLPGREEDTAEFWEKLVDSLMSVLREQGKYPGFLKGYEVTAEIGRASCRERV